MNRYYFAYGSNMDDDQMAVRCPGAACAGVATLPDYGWIINERGYATIYPLAGHALPGVLWRLGGRHEKTLDRYEGYRSGLYDKCFREVIATDRTARSVLVYIDHRNQTPGPPRPGYLERIVRGAARHELPSEHQRFLEQWLEVSRGAHPSEASQREALRELLPPS